MTRATVFGAPLSEGGTVGVSAPSGPYFNRSDVLRSVEWWEERGYRVKLAEGVWARDDYVAGDPKSRAGDLVAMFEDPEVDVIQCLVGGYGAIQTLPFLDFEAIREHPKALIGYSDITALHVALLERTGLATIHGKNFMGMGAAETSAFTTDRVLDVLTGKGLGEVPHDPEDGYLRPIASGLVTAPLVGGNLSLLRGTVGTPWEFDASECILLFEQVHSSPWQIDSALTHLTLAGKLEGVVGVVVGELHDCDWRENRPEVPRTKSLEDVLEERLEPLGVPVLYGLPVGHGKHQAAVPLGVTATLDADARTLVIEEPGLRGADGASLNG